MLKLSRRTWYIAAGIVGLAYCLIEANGTGDLLIFLSAAGDLSQHTDIFRKAYFDGYHYYYSLLFALLLKPFWHLSFYWVKFFWLLLNLLLFLHMFRLLGRSRFVSRLNEKARSIFLCGTFLFSLRFLHENLHTSQISILILWCCVFGIYYIAGEKEIRGSALLALGINLKLLPLVFLPYLFYRGYFKALGLTLLFYILSMLIPYVFLDHCYYNELLRSWFSLINPANQQHILDVDERSFHGLSTLLSTLLVKNVPDYYALNLPRNIADVPLSTLAAVLMISRLSLIAFCLFFLCWPPFRKKVSARNRILETSYLLLVIPLIFPHQQHYAFIFIVPAFVCSWYYLVSRYKVMELRERLIASVLMALIYLSANLKILLGEFNRYFEHYKILSYGALLLIPLLVWVSIKFRKLPKGS